MSKKKENDLRKAALEGDVAALTTIIASGVNLESPHPKDGQTALMYASSNGYVDAMEVLIKAGAKLESRDKFGYTALHVAATTGEAKSILLLLASGCNVDARNKFGHSALKMAREEKRAAAIAVLENAMANASREATSATSASSSSAGAAAAPVPGPPPNKPKRAAPEGEEAPSKQAKAVHPRVQDLQEGNPGSD